MGIRITSDGYAHGTRVHDLETGTELRGIERIDVEPITAGGGLVRARLTFGRVRLELGTDAFVTEQRWHRLVEVPG